MALAIECIYTTLTIKEGQQKIATESIWRVPQSSPLLVTRPDSEKVKTCKVIDTNIFVFQLKGLLCDIGRFATILQEKLLFSRFVCGRKKAISKLLQKFSGLCFTISRQHCIGDQVFPTLCSAGWHLVPAPLKVNQDQMHCVGMNAVHCSLGPRPTGPFLICTNEDSSCKQKEFSALVQSAGSTVSHPHYRLGGTSFSEFIEGEKKRSHKQT